jgi:hypothetical protein
MSDATIIDVTFVDQGTGREFLQLKLPVRQLPESVFPIGKHDWVVVQRTPASDKEIVKAREVRIVLRKAEYVDPSTILFSLPTVADEIPEELVEGAVTGALPLHQDDWLQLELVPNDVVPRTSTELGAIKKVLAEERQGAGFKRLHIRKALPAPFEGSDLQLGALRALFGAERPLTWLGGAGALKHCFAFLLPSGAWLYGQERAGKIVALGLTARDSQAVARLDQLTLIDWCAGEVYEAAHG